MRVYLSAGRSFLAAQGLSGARATGRLGDWPREGLAQATPHPSAPPPAVLRLGLCARSCAWEAAAVGGELGVEHEGRGSVDRRHCGPELGRLQRFPAPARPQSQLAPAGLHRRPARSMPRAAAPSAAAPPPAPGVP